MFMNQMYYTIPVAVGLLFKEFFVLLFRRVYYYFTYRLQLVKETKKTF